jgi:hypothetical protein
MDTLININRKVASCGDALLNLIFNQLNEYIVVDHPEMKGSLAAENVQEGILVKQVRR